MVPGVIQGVIDSIDAQINKDRSPVVNVLLGMPLYIIVSLPLAFIVGVMAILFTGTAPTVAQQDTSVGIIAGAITAVVFWSVAAYATYTTSK